MTEEAARLRFVELQLESSPVVSWTTLWSGTLHPAGVNCLRRGCGRVSFIRDDLPISYEAKVVMIWEKCLFCLAQSPIFNVPT